MKTFIKFCICIMLACLILIIDIYVTSPKVSNNQHEIVSSIDIEDTKSFPFQKSVKTSDKLIPISFNDSSKDELEISKIMFDKGARIRILKDNKYGNEYIVVSTDSGLGIFPRRQH